MKHTPKIFHTLAPFNTITNTKVETETTAAKLGRVQVICAKQWEMSVKTNDNNAVDYKAINTAF